MALTREFKETAVARVQSDPAFAQAPLDEAITLFVNGEPDSAKLIFRRFSRPSRARSGPRCIPKWR